MQHPYVGHRPPEKVAAACDLVEVLNRRTRAAQNSRARELARSLGNRGYAGADAHFARSICDAVIEVENLKSLPSSILDGSPRWETAQIASRWQFGAPLPIKAWKRDAALAL
jgi:predicted metal-dependent phosphoesterase TrpH